MDNTLLYSQFKHYYSLQKTLRFELKPIAETLQHIKKNQFIEEDLALADKYQAAKKIIDQYHRFFIETHLQQLILPIELLKQLSSLITKHQKEDKDKKEITKLQSTLKKQISHHFTQQDLFKEQLFKKKLFSELLPTYLDTQQNSENDHQIIATFSTFTTYFTGFNQTRKNIYSDKQDHVSIPYRLIHDNLPKYIKNSAILQSIQENRPLLWQQLEQNIQKFTDQSLSDLIQIESYNTVLTQSGIDRYNLFISGDKTQDLPLQGMNELINLYQQKNKERIPFLVPLYKQILSDTTSRFILDQIENNTQLLEILQHFHQSLTQDWLSALQQALSSLTPNSTTIWVQHQALSKISQSLFQQYDFIDCALNAYYDEVQLATLPTKKREKEKEKLKAKTEYSLNELQLAIDYYYQHHLEQEKTDNRPLLPVIAYFMFDEAAWYHALNDQFTKLQTDLTSTIQDDHVAIQQNTTLVEQIKLYLDTLNTCLHQLKPLSLPNDFFKETDPQFYGLFSPCYQTLAQLIPIYNKVRNYLTKKPYSIKKIKLNFNNSQLLHGWDVNKEKENTAIILKRDHHYFLGIINKKHNKIFETISTQETTPLSQDHSPYYEKMQYKFATEAVKMLPKKFFSDKWRHSHTVPDDIDKNYKAKTHTKGEHFNLTHCRQLIDYFKTCIALTKDWQVFNFQFSETDTYQSIDEFYREFDQQNYRLSFTAIPKATIDQFIAEGKLYLFQIWTKDFSPYSKGRLNLHSLYWLTLFSKRNQSEIIYKLNGEAEIFWRQASIPSAAQPTHPKGKPIANKNPNNPKKESVFDYDLTKNKRFTEDKFLFHVPITLNKNAKGIKNINPAINQFLVQHPQTNIIGIDRGERHLIYITVINSKGNILAQKSLNVLQHEHNHIIDYQKKLHERENQRLDARRSWQSISSIKELKQGYLSQVIHEIVQIMLDYQAIIVMEDLNTGFKQTRTRIEKQVYQRFEKALIDKLNYLVIKQSASNNRFDIEQNESLFNALQLSNQFESFVKLGKQSGIIFYISPWMTSKIDPTTGFVDLLRPRYTNISKAQQWFNTFRQIRFNPTEHYFEFEFDYQDFQIANCGYQTHWTLCSHGDTRFLWNKKSNQNKGGYEKIDVTHALKNLFDQYQISYITGEDIKPSIVNIQHAEFFRLLIKYINCILAMRQGNGEKGSPNEDFLLSPVKNKQGYFFDSRSAKPSLPQNPDANGAYHIALKGAYLLSQLTEDALKAKPIKNVDWLNFAQNR